jgi:hypothetical protein
MHELQCRFTAELWMYQGKSAWFFVTLPRDESQKIQFFAASPRRGFGSVRVTAQIGGTEWQTSIFPDSKSKSYVLPVKAAVRKKESLAAGKPVAVTLTMAL